MYLDFERVFSQLCLSAGVPGPGVPLLHHGLLHTSQGVQCPRCGQPGNLFILVSNIAFEKQNFLSERIFSLNLNELSQGFHSQTIRNCSKFFFSEISKHNKKTISMISCAVEFYIISLKQGFGADLFGGGSGNF